MTGRKGLMSTLCCQLVRLLGLPDRVSLALLGVSLIGYALPLWFNVHRPRLKLADAWIPHPE